MKSKSKMNNQLTRLSIYIVAVTLAGSHARGCLVQTDPFEKPIEESIEKLSVYKLKNATTEIEAVDKICLGFPWKEVTEYFFYESPSLYAKSLGELVLVCKTRMSSTSEASFSGNYHIIDNKISIKQVAKYGIFDSMKVFAARDTKYIDYVSAGVVVQDMILFEYASSGTYSVSVLGATETNGQISVNKIKLGQIKTGADGCASEVLDVHDYKYDEATGDVMVTLNLFKSGYHLSKDNVVLTIKYNKDKQVYQEICASDKLDGCPL